MTPSRQRVLIAGLITFGVLFVCVFGTRAFHAFRQFHGHRPPPLPLHGAQPAETDVNFIHDWMTIPFISITYGLPPNLLYKTLDIPPNGNEKKSLKQLNDEYFPEEPGIVIEKVKAAILANQLTPTAVPPDPPAALLTAPSPSTPVPPVTP